MIKKLELYEETPSGYKHPENIIQDKINELVDAVKELQNRIDPPSVYQVMKDKDAIIGRHIGEKQRLQDELDRTRKALEIAIDAMKISNEIVYSAYGSPLKTLKDALEQIKTALKQKDVK